MKNLLHRFEPVGSRVTCDPAPMNTDEDWLVLSKSPSCSVVLTSILMNKGYKRDGGRGYAFLPSVFGSFRKEEKNVILTHDLDFFCRFMAATSVAKRLNLLEKMDRISLFRAVLYGEEDELWNSRVILSP